MRGIADLASKVLHVWRQYSPNKQRGVRITVSTSCFIPKPHSPFQWEAQVSICLLYTSPYLDKLDMVLVMTVEPGFGGQSFMADMLPKIRGISALIKEYRPACELEVDGGIDDGTAPLVVDAGANVLVAGSAVFGKPDRAAAIAGIRMAADVKP